MFCLIGRGGNEAGGQLRPSDVKLLAPGVMRCLLCLDLRPCRKEGEDALPQGLNVLLLLLYARLRLLPEGLRSKLLILKIPELLINAALSSEDGSFLFFALSDAGSEGFFSLVKMLRIGLCRADLLLKERDVVLELFFCDPRLCDKVPLFLNRGIDCGELLLDLVVLGL